MIRRRLSYSFALAATFFCLAWAPNWASETSQPSRASQLEKARALLGQQKPAAAESILRNLSVKFPADPRPHFLLGYAFHLQKSMTTQSSLMVSLSTRHRPAVVEPQRRRNTTWPASVRCRIRKTRRSSISIWRSKPDSATWGNWPRMPISRTFAKTSDSRNSFRRSCPTKRSSPNRLASFTRFRERLRATSSAGPRGESAIGTKTASSILSPPRRPMPGPAMFTSTHREGVNFCSKRRVDPVSSLATAPLAPEM